jgi:hypothetical protein
MLEKQLNLFLFEIELYLFLWNKMKMQYEYIIEHPENCGGDTCSQSVTINKDQLAQKINSLKVAMKQADIHWELFMKV